MRHFKMDAKDESQKSLSSELNNMEFSLEEYLRTVFDEKLTVKMPEAEDNNLTSSTKLLEKYKELKNIKNSLKTKKEEFKVKMEAIEQRRHELEQKESNLKESLIKFEQFFKDNDEKRMRALKKLSNERQLQQQRQSEINKLNVEISRLSRIKDKKERKMKALQKYKLFLNSVVGISDEFSDVQDLISRYAALEANLKDLKLLDFENQQTIDELTKSLNRYKEEKQEEKLSLTNKIAELQNSLEKQRITSRSKENQWEYSTNAAANRIRELGTILISISNMYNIVRTHQKYGENYQPSETCKQLDTIKYFIVMMSKIIEEVREKTTSN